MHLIDLTLGYQHNPLLRGVNLTIERGSWIFLTGPSGSGKSTILQTIFGNLPPLGGSLIDDAGRDIYQLSPKDRRAYRRRCGMIFQDYKLIQYKTVAENIAYAMEICRYTAATIRTRVPKLLDYVGLHEKSDEFPATLSGGEAQRVAIARALIHSPEIILADEPTGNLDHINIANIMELLKSLHQSGTTIVFATHDRELLTQVAGATIIDVTQFR